MAGHMPERHQVDTPAGRLEWFEHIPVGGTAPIRTQASLARRVITIAELEQALATFEPGPFDDT